MSKTEENEKCGASCEKRQTITYASDECNVGTEWVRQILKTNINTMKCA
jgi:hypothetical protein